MTEDMKKEHIVKRRDVSWIQDENNRNESKFEGPFEFIQSADCQYGLIDAYIKQLKKPGWDEENRLTELLVDEINNMVSKPQFMVICGDLANAYPGDPVRQDQVRDFKRIFGKLNPQVELLCVCGNHDIGNEPTESGLAEYKRDFGDDYYYFVLNGVLFIVINSQFYESRRLMQDYAGEQDRWLETLLAECKNFKYSIVFQHIPWFLAEPQEDDEYFNINKDIRLHWLDKFVRAGVSKIMCGHYHRNAGGWYKGMEQVVTSAIGGQLGADKSGYRMVRVGHDSIEHTYHDIKNQ